MIKSLLRSHCAKKDSNGKPLIERNINLDHNLTKDAKKFGLYRFKFYHFGEWHDVIVDDRIMDWNYGNILKKGNGKSGEKRRSYWPLLFTKEKK